MKHIRNTLLDLGLLAIFVALAWAATDPVMRGISLILVGICACMASVDGKMAWLAWNQRRSRKF